MNSIEDVKLDDIKFDNKCIEKILFLIDTLKDFGCSNNGYKIKEINFESDKITWINDENKTLTASFEKLKKIEETKLESYTESELPVTGGSTNVFQKIKYSDTSSLKLSEIPNYSITSSAVFGKKSDKYFDIPSIKQLGGNLNEPIDLSETSSFKLSEIPNYSITSSALFDGKTDKYTDIPSIKQSGGNHPSESTDMSDTLMSMSELKLRKKSNSSNLDLGIFKKNQSGGNANNINIRQKMRDVGINSNSSTSSICE